MNLQTKYFIEGGVCTVGKENKNDIAKSIKLTAKYKINIQSRVDVVFDEFQKIARIEKNKDKKKQFFNKHKNQ